LVTYYVLFFIHLESRKIKIGRITPIRMKSGCATRSRLWKLFSRKEGTIRVTG